MANKTIKATLIIEDKKISVDELNDLFTGATTKIKGLSFLITQQAHKANTLCKYLFTAMKDGKSSAIMVDEIDLERSLPALVKLAAKVNNKMEASGYTEAYDMFCSDLKKAESVHHETRFLGMSLYVTKIEDPSGQQKGRCNKEWLENFLDINFNSDRKSLTLDVSATFFGQPD